MKIAFIFLLISSLGIPCCLSQNHSSLFKIEWGTGQRLKRKEGNVINIFGSDKEGFYTLSSWNSAFSDVLYRTGGTTSFQLNYYTNDLKRVHSKNINLDNRSIKRTFESMFQMRDNRFYLFTSFLNQKRENVLNVQLMKPKSLQLSSNYKEVHRLSFAGYGKNNSGSYGFKMSSDSTKLLVFYNLPYQKNANEKFGFKVFDQHLKPIWEKEIELPYTDELFNLERIQVDNEGNLFILGRVFKNKVKLRANGKPNYELALLVYRNHAKDLNEYQINLAEKYIADVKMLVDERGVVTCAGLYSDIGQGGVKGVFHKTIDIHSQKTKNEQISAFETEFIMSGEENSKQAIKKLKKGREILFAYYLNEIIDRNDGGFLLIAEQYYDKAIQTNSFTGGISRNYTKYFYNDVLLVSIGANGKLEWTEKIHKDQVTVNDQGFYSSYQLSKVDDKLYFLFNDHKDNLNLKAEDRREFNARGGVINLVEVDRNGNQKKYPLYDQLFKEPMIRPLISRQLRNEIIMVGIFGREQRIGKVKLNGR